MLGRSIRRRELLHWAGLGLGAASRASAQPDPSLPPLVSLWIAPSPDLVEVTLTPDGSRVLLLDRAGKLQCRNQEGAILWTQLLPGTDRVLSSRRGGVTLAYSRRQAHQRRAAFIDASGRHFYTLELSEPIETAAVSPDGRHAMLAAGKSVIFSSPENGTVRYRSVATPGFPRQLFHGRGDTFYSVCRDPNVTVLLKSSGKVLWRHSDAGSSYQSASVSLDGQVLGLAAEQRDGTISVALWQQEGRPRFLAERPGRKPRLRVAGNGQAAALAYEHQSRHDTTVNYGQRLALLTVEDGSIGGWSKGGAFTAPLFVGLDREARWVIALDTQRRREPPRIRLFGRAGEKRYSIDSAADILIAASAADGSTFATYRADGKVEMFAVHQQD